MIRYLADSTAIWRLSREQHLNIAWGEDIDLRVIGSCAPQRTEFRRSARNRVHYEQMGEMFADLYPDVPLPKNVWGWVESAQFRLAQAGGAVRALSTVDLLICGTAAHHGLIVLHDDNDFVTAAGVLADVSQCSVRDIPFR
ncbi:putative nucleic acid-binding protein [Kitasatospora sp. GP30]|uniref:VapC toxin family PIN domain ribonuclease n=1 Tax=Kitasatospora sp. GP30 TaxID=3035084 RepID=UPI000C6FDCDA|nr:VapC toxin family PIN domain ribonuclease [Kitasatospora sp. GP30]MDH6141557.1 putative nucleic acid-binding protein [Kitasatospora sp. GP30]